MLKKGGELVDTFLYPARCVGCGLWYSCKSDAWWCGVCESARLKARPITKEIEEVRIYATHEYDSKSVARAIHAFKYSGIDAVGEFCGDWVVKYFDTVFSGEKRKIFIVPVPLHADRLYERGFNQAAIIADKIVSVSSLSNVARVDALVRIKNTASQAKLDEAARKKQMNGVFSVVCQTEPEAVYVIIDDVVTTGSTVAACARELVSAGAKNVYGFCIAGTSGL